MVENGTGMFFGVKGHWSPINLSALHQSWTIHHPDGNSSRRIEKTSRVVWKLFFGDIPPGLEIVSLDGSNRPETLRALTHSETLRLKRGSLDPATLPVPPYDPAMNREWESNSADHHSPRPPADPTSRPSPATEKRFNGPATQDRWFPFRLTEDNRLVAWNPHSRRWGSVNSDASYIFHHGKAYDSAKVKEKVQSLSRLPRLYVYVEDGPDALP